MGKNKRSALYYYADEYRRRTDSKIGVPQAIEECYLEWKSLTPTEKAPYERMYENWRNTYSDSNTNFSSNTSKLSSNVGFSSYKSESGASSSVASERLDAPLLKRLPYVKIQLTDMMKKLKDNSKQSMKDIIMNHKWYIIKFQTFCRADTYLDSAEGTDYKPYFVLAELSLAEYSLANGITNTYHKFIPPNKIPLGYQSAVMESHNVHQIPYKDFCPPIPKKDDKKTNKDEEVKRMWEEMYTNILEFMGISIAEESICYEPIFCLRSDSEETEFGLKFLNNQFKQSQKFQKSGFSSEIMEIFDLESLVMFLSHQARTEVSYHSAKDVLTQYTYDYAANSKCKFHEEKGVTHCSLGYVNRFCYLISDSVCCLYDIKLTLNHVPKLESSGTVVRNDQDDLKSNKYGIKSSLPFWDTRSTCDGSDSRSGYGTIGSQSNTSVSVTEYSSRDIRISSKSSTQSTYSVNEDDLDEAKSFSSRNSYVSTRGSFTSHQSGTMRNTKHVKYPATKASSRYQGEEEPEEFFDEADDKSVTSSSSSRIDTNTRSTCSTRTSRLLVSDKFESESQSSSHRTSSNTASSLYVSNDLNEVSSTMSVSSRASVTTVEGQEEDDDDDETWVESGNRISRTGSNASLNSSKSDTSSGIKFARHGSNTSLSSIKSDASSAMKISRKSSNNSIHNESMKSDTSLKGDGITTANNPASNPVTTSRLPFGRGRCLNNK